MISLRSLRGRLALALLAVFVVALAVSTSLDELTRNAVHLRDVAELDSEPYQDGLVLALFSVPALALIWLVSWWSLRPLDRARAEALRAGPRNPHARLTRDGLPAEIAPLVDAVNDALQRMAEGMEAERRFTENAAHELRTPLAVLKLRLQRAQHNTSAVDWAAIDHDVAQLQRLVSQLLDLARKEHAGRDSEQGETLNLSRIAREAAAMVLPLAEAQNRTLIADLPDDLPATGHADDLRDAVRNLLENAVLHGKGAITLSAEKAAHSTILIIADDGPGIAPDMRDRAFDRFAKGNGPGSGLGLAIVREVARRHAGTATLLPGPGCRVGLSIGDR